MQWGNMYAMSKVRVVIGTVFVIAALTAMVVTGGTQRRGSTGFYVGGALAILFGAIAYLVIGRDERSQKS